jgi:type IV secretion system protein VirB10
MAEAPRDPNLAGDPGQGIKPPGTTMKARPQGERIVQGLLLPGLILAAFIGFIGVPTYNSWKSASAKPTPTATPYAYATGASSPNPSDIADIVKQQAQEAGQTANTVTTAALNRIGAGNLVSPAPAAGPSESHAQHDARVAADVRSAYDSLNSTNTGNPSNASPYGYNLVAGYNPPGGQTPPPPSPPPPVTTPPPPGPRIQGMLVTTVTPPPRAIAQESEATPAPAPAATSSNPYNRGGVFVPGPSGINYVGVEPGQNAGQTPQTTGLMRVANQANFLTSPTGDIYSSARQASPLSYDEIFPGRPIHWVPDVNIVSSLPGNFYGHITEDVVSNLPVPCGKDTCPHELLIPNGTFVKGTYNADVQSGETRIQTHLTLLIFPNGTTLALSDVQGSDQQGANGLQADVDNHVGRIYTVTLIGAVLNGIGNAVALASSLQAPYSLGAATAQGFGQSLADRSTQAASQQLQQPPTLTVKAGTVQTFSFAQIQPLMPYRKTTSATNE